MTSAVPSLEALRAGPLLRRDRSIERDDWPIVDVLDRRNEDPTKSGPFAADLRRHIDGDRRVVCVLNRTGRARLLACAACGELVRSDDGGQIMRLVDDELVSADGSERRPVICTVCGSTALKTLRMGVERAREELEAFLGEPVDEITAASEQRPQQRVAIGTEAVLHRVDRADVVVFLDFDQELLAVRQRAAEQAMAMISQAARLVGGRGSGGRVVVQTRQPEHEVILAAGRGDPALVAVAERDRRRPLRLPPYGAQVSISGEGAACVDRQLRHGGRRAGARTARWSLVASPRATTRSSIASPRSNVQPPACGSTSIRCEYDGVDQRQRRLFLSVLAVLGVIGFILVFGERTTGPPLESVVSAEGLVTEIPEGWVQSEQFAFEWQPIAGNPIAEVFDKWTVARACGPGGCDERSLDEWLEIGESLPTFVQAVAADSGLTINRDEFGDDHRVVEGTTAAETTIVYVAAFDDGWNFYVECGLSLGVRGDDRLIDEIVEVCRATVPVGE